jgi:transcriptional regulator with XRE-family HTH domain
MPKPESLTDRLKYLICKTTRGKHTLFAKHIGIPTSTFQNIINGQFPKAEHLIQISEKCGVSIDWLLLGKGEPYLSTEDKDDNSRGGIQVSAKDLPQTQDISDAEIVDQFNDKKYARELSLHLVELERLSSEAFKKVDPYIKGLLDGLRMKPTDCCGFKGTNRRSTERRVKDKPGKFKGAKDRRSGKDRRVAVQR